MAEKFALITHPYDLGHLRRILQAHKPGGRLPSDALLARVFEWTPPFKLGEWQGVRSATGATVDGVNVCCPIMPRMPTLGPTAAFEKVRDACLLAATLGARIAALGGFTSILGSRGAETPHPQGVDSRGAETPRPHDIEANGMAVTTGNSLTAAMAVQGIERAARALGLDLARATVAIIGASGDIGAGCARALAGRVGRLILAARSQRRLDDLAASLETARPSSRLSVAPTREARVPRPNLFGRAASSLRVVTDNRLAVAEADVVLCVASAAAPILEPEDLRPGSIVCDVGYPKNVAARAADRPDVFVFDGGLVATPSAIDFGVDNGLPGPNVLYGCFAEGIVLALAGRFESFSRGKGNVTPAKMAEIAALADVHGFRLAPFTSGGRPVPEAELAARCERLGHRQ